MKIAIILTFTFLLSSCANYINKVHRELDKGDAKNDAQRKRRSYDTFGQFRSNKDEINSSNRNSFLPKVKRKYGPERSKRRYTSDDLTDNTNPGSLWAGSGNENYLFTKNKWKRNGDIVLLKVQGRLKDEITAELKRAFPVMPTKKTEKDKGATKADSAATSSVTPVTNEGEDKKDQVHDRISSVIIEEISKDHLLLRGQKYLLFRNRKHLVEIQALIARRDIQDDDTVESSQLLETSVTVLR